jgi:hypothetical protein
MHEAVLNRGGFSVSKKSTRCQENECFIFLSCIIFLCRPSKGVALRRVRLANLQFAIASRANALPPLSPLVTAEK